MWTAFPVSEDAASWGHGVHSDTEMNSESVHTPSIITLQFVNKKMYIETDKHPLNGICDSRLGSSVTSLELSLSFSGGDGGLHSLTV